MLWTVLVILLILSLLGVVSSYIVGGFILFGVALGAVLIRILEGRTPDDVMDRARPRRRSESIEF
jgi:hypothetical protein